MVLCRIQQDARNSAVSHRRLTLCRVWVADDIASDMVPGFGRHIDQMTIPWSKTKAEWNLLKFVEICQEHVLKKCQNRKWCSSVPPANSTMLQHVAPSSSSNSVISWFWDHGGSTNGKMMKDYQSHRISVQSSKYLNILQLSAICKVTTAFRKLKMWSLIAPFPGLLTSDCSPDVHDTWVKRAHGSRQLSTCQFESESEKCKNDLP